MTKQGLLAGGAMLLALAGCASTAGAEESASSAGSRPATTREDRIANRDPYPSTYRAYPSVATVVTNVTIFDGEGGRIDGGQILMADGKIVAVGQTVEQPAGATVIDGTGKWVTPGIIDVHSHLGDYPSPGVDALSDGNEATDPATPEVWAEHSVWPQDPGFTRALANGGVTTLQILPGSANLTGGRSVTVKNVPGRTMQQMKFPGAPYGLKMACGENPKRVYGERNRAPSTRMGNIAVNRQMWMRAQEYDRRWDAWEENGRGNAPNREADMDTLREVLDGRIQIHNHCYRADEMAIVIDMAKEFGYTVSTFHHAVESYKIADLLRENEICSAMWSDWWGFKMESYDAINENIPLVHNAGACAIVHSDDPDGIQRLNQEAAKALADGRRMGIQIADEVAWTWLAINPARAIGVDEWTGSLKAGKMADVVLWNGNPLSVYTRPEKVWIDGALMFDANDPARRPVTDFELGQPGEGDVK
ncbi:imidazolonepropionase-like amidohydrolase [Sphingomonas jejuensis]|uniref:Imidazolonepropionase-like amidohydrolase n=1 Tax=Sphingomonas jejuensis TaxID=904715 RepID=A0ABX0XL58_9SPHN|nr:amidohydrolase [Sphingomonas jejuensis]NJC34093.1 imidazolonepropionase-like amidohydrolase [Sphingomonas jejuensis]